MGCIVFVCILDMDMGLGVYCRSLFTTENHNSLRMGSRKRMGLCSHDVFNSGSRFVMIINPETCSGVILQRFLVR